MKNKLILRRIKQSIWPKIIVVSAIAYPIGVWAQSGSEHVISQKNRTYAPKEIQIAAWDVLKIVNDDIFLHNALIESENLSFDSGSMEEGESASVTFDTPGAYTVKCAIHPKMKLNVTVK